MLYVDIFIDCRPDLAVGVFFQLLILPEPWQRGHFLYPELPPVFFFRVLVVVVFTVCLALAIYMHSIINNRIACVGIYVLCDLLRCRDFIFELTFVIKESGIRTDKQDNKQDAKNPQSFADILPTKNWHFFTILLIVSYLQHLWKDSVCHKSRHYAVVVLL